jgi:hypothetical protein
MKHSVTPEVEFVPLGKMTVYAVTEMELLEIQRGSADSIFLVFGVACLSLCLPTALSILLLDSKNVKTYSAYCVIAILSGIAGLVLLFFWNFHRTNTQSTVEIIFERKTAVGLQAPNSPLPPAMKAPEQRI